MSLSYFQQFASTFELVKLYIVGKLRSHDTSPYVVKAHYIPGFVDYTAKLQKSHRAAAKKEIYPLSLIKPNIPDNVKNCGEGTLFVEYTHDHQTYVYPLRYPDDESVPFPPGSYEMTFTYSDNDTETRTPLSAVLKRKDNNQTELDVYDDLMKFMGPNNDFFVSNGLMLNVYLLAEWIGWRNDGKWVLEVMDDMGEEHVFDPEDILCLPKSKYNRPPPPPAQKATKS